MDFRSARRLRVTNDVNEDYAFSTKQLGSGNFGQVHEAMHTRTEVECAVKIIDKVKLKKRNDDRYFELLKSEIDVLQQTSHPNIVHVF